MKTLKAIKELLKEKQSGLKSEHHIKRLGIFGSYGKGTASQKSDLDVLVEFSDPPTFFKFIQLQKERQAAFRGTVSQAQCASLIAPRLNGISKASSPNPHALVRR